MADSSASPVMSSAKRLDASRDGGRREFHGDLRLSGLAPNGDGNVGRFAGDEGASDVDMGVTNRAVVSASDIVALKFRALIPCRPTAEESAVLSPSVSRPGGSSAKLGSSELGRRWMAPVMRPWCGVSVLVSSRRCPAGRTSSGGRALRIAGFEAAAGLRRQMNNELNFPPNFEGLVLGCIDADFIK